MWTRTGKPWSLKAYFIFEDKGEAMEGEKYLKTFKNPGYINLLTEEGWTFNGKIHPSLSSVG
jgi:hypothetical protein